MKPSSFKLAGFTGSGLQSSEAETITSNIFKMMKSQDDEFKPFTWAGYKKFCSHRVTDSEREVIELLVKGGWYYDNIGGKSMITGGMLKKTGSKYEVTDKLIELLGKFQTTKKVKVQVWIRIVNTELN